MIPIGVEMVFRDGFPGWAAVVRADACPVRQARSGETMS